MRNNKGIRIFIGVLVALLVILTAVALLLPKDTPQPTEPSVTDGTSEPTTEPVTEPPTEPTEPPVQKVSTATISSVGDMLMHKPVFNTGYNSATGEYNLDSIFSYFTDYVRSADLAVANLETTLAGTAYPYRGWPQFNCPDAIADSLKTAGFGLILTANNHSYDTGTTGLMRTQQVLSDLGLPYLGTKTDAEVPNYILSEVNGIRIGMMCYTYETTNSYSDRISLNDILLTPEDSLLINSFDYADLPAFYGEMEENITELETQGAEAVMLFIHWGDEYHLEANNIQKEMAQKLCDLGVDVIVGGHPHVVEPVELLTSTSDEAHKTLCLYSMGNAVSNQRLGNISSIDTAHTEDGVMFSVTFAKYSDGTVIVESADALPIWVDLRYDSDWNRQYCILPLDTQIEDWKTRFGLTDETLKMARDSYDRTMAIVGDGMAQAESYYSARQAQVEADLGVLPN
ncbi:MAG: CapA family protein [Firmicutes bacterium]|nr:CapA family protein [Bacillota bacterium]